MNLWRTPSPVLPPSPRLRRTGRTPSPPVGEREGGRGYAGSWRVASQSQKNIERRTSNIEHRMAPQSMFSIGCSHRNSIVAAHRFLVQNTQDYENNDAHLCGQ